MSARVPSARERILAALSRGPLTHAELTERLPYTGNRISCELNNLRHAGIVQCSGYRGTWSLVKA